MAMLGRRIAPSYLGAMAPVSLPGATPPIADAPGGFNLPELPTLKAPHSHNWIGILADALSGLAGGPGIYAPMAERRAQEQTAFDRGEEQWRSHHQQDLADQMQLLDYRRLHPDDALSQSLDQAGITDQAERQKYYRADVERRTAPPMMSAQGVDEQGNPVMRFFPRAQPMAPSTTPAPAVGTVKGGYRFKGGNPASPDAWEPAGGAGSGPRTFPY